MKNIEPGLDLPWLVFGDFNEILWASKKLGGPQRNSTSMVDFRETITNLRLLDLGYTGYRYTWSNGRSGDANVQVCLDRALGTQQWKTRFPMYSVHHKIRFCSDHAPITVDCRSSNSHQSLPGDNSEKLFRFEKIWMEYEECREVIKKGWGEDYWPAPFEDRTRSCGVSLDLWGHKEVGKTKREIRKIKERLDFLQQEEQTAENIAEQKSLEADLEELLKLEETIWF